MQQTILKMCISRGALDLGQQILLIKFGASISIKLTKLQNEIVYLKCAEITGKLVQLPVCF